MAPLVAEIAKRFEQRHSGVRIDVQTGGSSRGIADARRGTADIGMVSRSLNDDEQDLTNHVIARDGVCLIVHQENGLRELNAEQVVAIYTGKVRKWSEWGGPDAAITVVNKAAGRSTLELFVEYFSLDVAAIEPHVVIGDNQQGIKTIAGDPHSIGYVSIGSAQFEAARGVPIRLLSLDGVEPNVATVRDGSFPLARPLNLVVPRHERITEMARSKVRAASPLVELFLQFATSPVVADLVEAQSFVAIAD
jgi:phosphate transport system substrate-binding protein